MTKKMNFRMLRSSALLSLAVLLLCLPAFAQVTVIFTRHAEKAANPPKDPPLTEAGRKRAELLAAMLADSGVTAIYVTELQRTQQTAAPLAARTGVKPTVIPANDTPQLVNAIRAQKTGVVVVVGHSNTLPGIISALGGPKVEIPDSDYDNLFVLTLGTSQSSLLRLHYGSSVRVPPPENNMKDMTPPKN